MSRRLSTLLVVLAAITGLLTIYGQSSADASQWKGKSSGCSVQLPSSNGPKSYLTFNTCPPKRVLLVGDSVALTMGIEMAWHEQNWGTLVDDAALNGCGFVTGDRVDVTGSFLAMNAHCDTEGAQWVADVKSFKPQAIVIEMGWWDSQEHLINGAVASLGQSGYDAALQQQMVGLVQLLQGATAAPIFLLSVPWMDPPLGRMVRRTPEHRLQITLRSTASSRLQRSRRRLFISSMCPSTSPLPGSLRPTSGANLAEIQTVSISTTTPTRTAARLSRAVSCRPCGKH